MKRLRNYFITGLIVLVPIVVTLQLLVWLFKVLDGLLGGLVTQVFGRPLPGVGLAVTVIVILAVGVLAANYFGRRLIRYGEDLMRRTPIVRSVYVTMKQITDAFVRQEEAVFKRVAVLEYPRRGMYSLAFVTSPPPRELGDRVGQDLVGLFLPTTPNPTSGFLLYVPRHDVTILDMSVEDGFKLLISGGVFSPGERPGLPAITKSGDLVTTGRAAGDGEGGDAPEASLSSGGDQEQ